MPELPEVETIVRGLVSQGLVGACIQRATVRWPRTVDGDVGLFKQSIQEKRITGVQRRGKYIHLTLSDQSSLLIHLRMTGRLYFRHPSERYEKHEHVILHLKDRQLRFKDTRKFGRWTLLADSQQKLGTLGPEPLNKLAMQSFESRLQRGNRQLKPLLLDQTFIVGLGNIYVDEALWDAHLHPLRRSGKLSRAERIALKKAIPKVLKRGIANMGTSLGDSQTNYYSVAGRRGRNQAALKVFRRTGEPCPRCATRIERLVVAQRSTHICSQCQN